MSISIGRTAIPEFLHIGLQPLKSDAIHEGVGGLRGIVEPSAARICVAHALRPSLTFFVQLLARPGILQGDQLILESINLSSQLSRVQRVIEGFQATFHGPGEGSGSQQSVVCYLRCIVLSIDLRAGALL